MKRTIIAIAMATLLTSPAISDEFMHKETGKYLDLMETDDLYKMYFTGFAKGVEWSCSSDRSAEVRRITGNKNIHEFVLEKLRNEHRKGTFYNWNTIELDAITFLKVHIKSIMCGERGYE